MRSEPVDSSKRNPLPELMLDLTQQLQCHDVGQLRGHGIPDHLG